MALRGKRRFFEKKAFYWEKLSFLEKSKEKLGKATWWKKNPRKVHFLKFSEKKSKNSFRFLLSFFEISIFNSFWVSSVTFLLFSIVLEKLKEVKFLLYFSLYIKLKKVKIPPLVICLKMDPKKMKKNTLLHTVSRT